MAQVNQLAAQASAQTSPPAGYSPVGDGPDSSKFLVSITSPADNSSFAWGSAIPLSTSVNFGATKVEYYDGFIKVGEASTAPFNYSLSNVGPGQHVLEAIATDANGERFSSNPVLFFQQPNVPPSISIASPGAQVSFQAGQTIPIVVNVADVDGAIGKIEFYAGAIKIGESTTSPFSFSWSGAAEGQYSLTVVATDNNGGKTVSSPVSTTIAPTPPPTPAPSATPVPTAAPTPTGTPPPPSPTPIPDPNATPPPPLRYTPVDLGVGDNVWPMRIGNNGWILLRGGPTGYCRWKAGTVEPLTHSGPIYEHFTGSETWTATDMNNSGVVVGASSAPGEAGVGLIWPADSSAATKVSSPLVFSNADPNWPGELRGARFHAITDSGEKFGELYTGGTYWTWYLYYWSGYVLNAARWPANGADPVQLSNGVVTQPDRSVEAQLTGSLDEIRYANARGDYVGLRIDSLEASQMGMVNGSTVPFEPVHLNARGIVIGKNWYSPSGFALDPNGTQTTLPGATYPIWINSFVRHGVDSQGHMVDVPAPQVVGYWQKSPDQEVAAVWEYAPNGQYVPHDLADVVSKSGAFDFNDHQFWYPQAMNDEGAIVAMVQQYDPNTWSYQWTRGVLLLPVEVKVTSANPPVGTAGSKYSNPDRPKNGNADNLFSVWSGEDFTVTIRVPASPQLPPASIRWTVEGETIPDNSKQYTFNWDTTGTKRVEIKVGESKFVVWVDVPDVGNITQGDALLAINPISSALIALYGRMALTYANQTWPSAQPKKDAIRHAYWTAMCASDILVDREAVLLVATAHEHNNKFGVPNFFWQTGVPQAAFNSTMDLRNNMIGLATGHFTLVGTPDFPAILADLDAQYQQGLMWIYDGDTSEGASEGILTKSNGQKIYAP